jgi:hypothetical protein
MAGFSVEKMPKKKKIRVFFDGKEQTIKICQNKY